MIKIKDEDLRKGAAEGMDGFIQVFTDAYMQAMGGQMTAESMTQLNGVQHTLLAYKILRDELMEGGFCQLIQNGYGAYIFLNPFAKVMKQWGLPELARIIYDARRIYDLHREDLEKERTDDEFMAMYEDYEAFDPLEEMFIENEEEYTALVANYVDEHIEQFAAVE
jgi:hypothetical protein